MRDETTMHTRRGFRRALTIDKLARGCHSYFPERVYKVIPSRAISINSTPSRLANESARVLVIITKMADKNIPTPAPQDLMIRYFHLLHGCPLERATMAFTASASVLAIYIQQFWNMLTYEAKIRAYNFQLDETRFVLDANILRDFRDNLSTSRSQARHVLY
ncbi:hypothetical protein Tco_1173095 [Tanacetum coccineum]